MRPRLFFCPALGGPAWAGTEAQRRRFLLYALDGLSLAEIGVLCGCSKVAVYQSVEAVRKKFINFFENRLNE